MTKGTATARTASARIRQSRIIPADPQVVYQAFADPRLHAAFTGTKTTGRAHAGARFTVGEGYISGRTLAVTPGRRIVQEWQTTDWPATAPPSRLELRFIAHPRGTKVTLSQTGVPRSQVVSYRDGWIQYYWRPLRAYFEAAKRSAKRQRAGGSTTASRREAPAIRVTGGAARRAAKHERAERGGA